MVLVSLRSAVFIAVSLRQVLDIPRVLDMLRQQRMMLVQTLGQYTFVYRVLIQFLKSSRLI
jgi:tyrosine-protein phosphatase non-receptor type 14/21